MNRISSPQQRVLRANVEALEPCSGAAASAGRRRMVAGGVSLVLAFGAVVVLGVVGVTGQFRPAHPAASATTGVATQATQVGEVTVETPAPVADNDVAGSAIVHDCFEVPGQGCLTANPKLHAALQLLETTATGAKLLETAVHAGVAVRLGRVDDDAWAEFDPRTNAVTVDTGTASMSPRGLAAVLAHELRHAANHASPGGLLPSNSLNCYQDEASAFTAEVAVWKEVRGVEPPHDELEEAEAETARQMDTRGLGFWLDEANDYRGECG